MGNNKGLFASYSKTSTTRQFFFYFFISLLTISTSGYSQTALKVTGGIDLSKGNINMDVLNDVIQQKQDEIFSRLFQNIIVKYFNNADPSEDLDNFSLYYGIYNIMDDITVGKSKTTTSKALISSISDLAYVYAFVKYYEDYQVNSMPEATRNSVNKIENTQIVTSVSKGKKNENLNSLLQLNFYLEAAFDVLSKDITVQSRFSFKKPLTSPEVQIWYNAIGLINNSTYNTLSFQDITGTTTNLLNLRANMQLQVSNFLASSTPNSITTVASLTKTVLGFETLTASQIDAIKLLLEELASKTDYLFDQNVSKKLIDLIVENTHFGTDQTQKVNQVYIDIESLILSLDKEFVSKQKRSSISSKLFWVNPRPFFTIGTSISTFLNNANALDNINGSPMPLKSVSFASEKIGFRVKVWDGGYTHSFEPGEVYKWHGYNYVWNRPQIKPLVSSVYYNFYASGLLYNVVNLKTNSNFAFGFVGSNIGVIFFNGLELSTGIACVWDGGLDEKNVFAKFDFDVPIIDYLLALRKKKG